MNKCPVNCVVSSWSANATCSKSCGAGVQTTFRTVTVQPAFGGAVCPSLQYSSECNTQRCPTDCVVSAWAAWSDCSSECGGGSKTRVRRTVQSQSYGGAHCPILVQTSSCNTAPCPIDCKMNAWTAWTSCSVSCGQGSQSRTRTVSVAAAHGGEACKPTSESIVCQLQPCPIDSQLSAWSTYTMCTKACGGGSKTRTRSVTGSMSHGGISCGTLTGTASCNNHACPVDCTPVDCVTSSWNQWGLCTKACATGSRARDRVVTKSSACNGQLCPSLRETQTCNTELFSINCECPCGLPGHRAPSPVALE